MKRSSQLTSNPDQVRAWQERSRRRMVTRAPLRCRPRGDLSGTLSSEAYGLDSKPRKAMKKYSTPDPESTKGLEKTLDDLTRKVLRQDERVSFTSGRCGTAEDPLEVSHLFGRALRPTRFDCHPDGNCHMQLRSENQAHNNDKSVYRNEYIRRFGQEAFDDLDRRAHQPDVWSWMELSKMILHREAMLR
jgi:hypothetical protein